MFLSARGIGHGDDGLGGAHQRATQAHLVELPQHRDEVKLHGNVARLAEQQKAGVAPVEPSHKRRQRVGGTSVRGV